MISETIEMVEMVKVPCDSIPTKAKTPLTDKGIAKLVCEFYLRQGRLWHILGTETHIITNGVFCFLNIPFSKRAKIVNTIKQSREFKQYIENDGGVWKWKSKDMVESGVKRLADLVGSMFDSAIEPTKNPYGEPNEIRIINKEYDESKKMSVLIMSNGAKMNQKYYETIIRLYGNNFTMWQKNKGTPIVFRSIQDDKNSFFAAVMPLA